MINTLDIVDILFAKADGSALKTAITGSICKHRRDPASNKEDIVINCLPINNDQLQKGFANVNIHVPDITVAKNKMQDKQPDHARLKVLATMAVGVFKDTWSGDYNFDVQQQTTIQDPEAGSHYINIRIEFNSINL